MNKSNIFTHLGKEIDASKLSKMEICHYMSIVDDSAAFSNLEHVRSLMKASVPKVKLYYPEPFKASPSFMHNDIFFIHILHYQF